jgi:ABC-type Zn uptake system ZnuABC Zn-binding protein ZnuA
MQDAEVRSKFCILHSAFCILLCVSNPDSGLRRALDCPTLYRRLAGKMKKITFLLLVLLTACSQPARHAGPLQVVTTFGVLADWARTVGGDRVQVTSLLTDTENPRSYQPKPSDARLLANSDIVFHIGIDPGDWLNPVVQSAGNRKLIVVDASKGVDIIRNERHGSDSAQAPAGNGAGNPYIWLDPENAKLGIASLVDAFCRLDPKNVGYYRTRQSMYYKRLDSLTQAIGDMVSSLSDRRLITCSDAWSYFARRFGFEIVATVESTAGRGPPDRQIADLVDLVRKQKIEVICTEPDGPSEVPEMVAKETGIKVVVVNPLEPAGADYIQMLGWNARQIADALR